MGISFRHCGNEPSEERCRGGRAEDPGHDNAWTSIGLIPAKVSLAARAIVTAGLANDVEDVNQ